MEAIVGTCFKCHREVLHSDEFEVTPKGIACSAEPESWPASRLANPERSQRIADFEARANDETPVQITKVTVLSPTAGLKREGSHRSKIIHTDKPVVIG